ncbi:hypothetical protein Q9966_003610 [Columba livia]|nr:hypothetical protein Q9966_003610 [Columba livia]
MEIANYKAVLGASRVEVSSILIAFRWYKRKRVGGSTGNPSTRNRQLLQTEARHGLTMNRASYRATRQQDEAENRAEVVRREGKPDLWDMEEYSNQGLKVRSNSFL